MVTWASLRPQVKMTANLRYDSTRMIVNLRWWVHTAPQSAFPLASLISFKL